MNGTYRTPDEQNEDFQNRTDHKINGVIKVVTDLGEDIQDIKDAVARTKAANPNSEVHYGRFELNGDLIVFDSQGNQIRVPVEFLPVVEPQDVADEASTTVTEFFTLYRLLSECSYASEQTITDMMYEDFERYKAWIRMLRATQWRVEKVSSTIPNMKKIDHKAWDDLLYDCRMPFTIPDKYLKKDVASFFQDSMATRYRSRSHIYSPPRFRRNLRYQPYDDKDDILGQHEITDDIVDRVNRGEMAYMTKEEDEAMKNMTDNPYDWTEFSSTPLTNSTRWVEATPVTPYHSPEQGWLDKIDVNQVITIGLAVLPSVFLFGLLLCLIKAINRLATANRTPEPTRQRTETVRSSDTDNSESIMLQPTA